MSEIFLDWAGLTINTLTVAVIVVLLAALISAIFSGDDGKNRIKFTNLNKQREKLRQGFQSKFSASKKAAKKAQKEISERIAELLGNDDLARHFVITFAGNEMAESETDFIKEIDAVLAVARPGKDEVVINLFSPGGAVFAYGKASDQLQRLKDANLKLTVCVDEVAASGGYMMACVADRLIAAPFSTIGSIGVVMGALNFHDLISKYGVKFECLTAGEFKRTLTPFGKNTDEDRYHVTQKLEEIHSAFKDHIHKYRPSVDLDTLANGDTWLGSEALEKGLIDEIGTYDTLMNGLLETQPVYQVEYKKPKEMSFKLSKFFTKAMARTFSDLKTKAALHSQP